MAPMTRGASPGGIPGADVAAYYARRAAGGTALIITEGCASRIRRRAGPTPSRTGATRGAAGWRAVTEAVHAEGGAIAAQLWHQGAARRARGDSAEQRPVSPSGVDVAGNAVGRALLADELPAVADAYARGAVNAREAGFDAVEIHGAHGYLLDQFLWAETNHRTDGYGGSLEARTRFPAEVVAAGPGRGRAGFPVIYRFSQWKMNRYDAAVAANPVSCNGSWVPWSTPVSTCCTPPPGATTCPASQTRMPSSVWPAGPRR